MMRQANDRIRTVVIDARPAMSVVAMRGRKSRSRFARRSQRRCSVTHATIDDRFKLSKCLPAPGPPDLDQLPAGSSNLKGH